MKRACKRRSSRFSPTAPNSCDRRTTEAARHSLVRQLFDDGNRTPREDADCSLQQPKHPRGTALRAHGELSPGFAGTSGRDDGVLARLGHAAGEDLSKIAGPNQEKFTTSKPVDWSYTALAITKIQNEAS